MIIGIDIGGTKTNIGLSYTGETIVDSHIIPTPRNQRKVISKLSSEIRKLVGEQQIDAIGITCPAPINKARGIITQPHHLPWHNLKLVTPLKKQFKCPVIIEHDATAGGIAEARFGAGKNYHYICYITISTGIGNALILDGKPLPGPNNAEGGAQIIDMHEAELNSKNGSYEDLASGSTIVRDFGARASEINSRSQWQLIARRFSYGIYNIIQIAAPECVILGGGVGSHYKKFSSALNKELNKFSPLYPIPPVIMAKNPETAPLMGIIYLAAQSLD